MKRGFSLSGVLVLSLVLAMASLGCVERTVPIQDYGNSTEGYSKKFSADQIGNAIVRAGGAIGWRMDKTSPGLITATVINRGHTVTVEIPYTGSGYSIKYRDSSNMMAQDGKIHRNYNRWVDRLNRNIMAEIGKIGQ